MANRAFYLVLGWETRPGTEEEVADAAASALTVALQDYPQTQLLDRLVLIGIRAAEERERLYGVLEFLKKAHDGFRYALSPAIAVGSRWSGWLPNDRWPQINRISLGLEVDEPSEPE